MTGSGSVLRYVAFGWMMLVGLVGGAFVVGETVDDPGGWAAAILVASWLVPFAALAWLALAEPELARPVFVGGTALVGAFTVADAAFGIVPRDVGPVAAIAVLVLAVALAVLGLRHTALTAMLLLALGAAQLLATLLDQPGGGPRLHLGGSSGAVVLPVLIGGLLFLVAGRGGETKAVDEGRHLTHTH